MSHKESKKVRQMYRREVKAKSDEYARSLFLDNFKTKPKWLPKIIWQFGFRLYFKVPKEAR